MTKRIVYLIHFSHKLAHARHYVGYTKDLENRLHEHRSNYGAKLLRALNLHGIAWSVVRTWEVKTKDDAYLFELRLKRWKGSGQLCPICSGQSAMRRCMNPERTVK